MNSVTEPGLLQGESLFDDGTRAQLQLSGSGKVDHTCKGDTILGGALTWYVVRERLAARSSVGTDSACPGLAQLSVSYTTRSHSYFTGFGTLPKMIKLPECM